MNFNGCKNLARLPVVGTWFRAVEPRYQTAPLDARYTKSVRSRFSPGSNQKPSKQFQMLYFSENSHVAEWEFGVLLGSALQHQFLSNPARSWLIINVRITLQQVVDLTSDLEQQLIETNAQELTGDWEGYESRKSHGSVRKPIGIAPTQALGIALNSMRNIEGFRCVSAKVPHFMNLVVFPDKLIKGSSLFFKDSSGNEHEVQGKL